MNSSEVGRKLTSLIAIAALCVMVFAMPVQAEDNEGGHARGALAVALPAGSTAGSNQLGIPTGSPLTGNFVIQKFVAQDGKLFAIGTLIGQAAGQNILVHGIMAETKATALPVQTSSIAGAPEGFKLAQAASCNILNLNINPIHLDLLGLVVDTSAISLNLMAQQGPGNLLGNLLCAITNALNGTGTTATNGLAGLLNRLLGALGGIA